MLKSQLLHPEMLRGLAEAGHGSQIQIANGNYPRAISTGERRGYANLLLTIGVMPPE